jgi:L-rhamnose-H+ transport protein
MMRLGFLFVLAAGILNGSFALPLKFTPRWSWENTWLIWAILGMAVFPTLLTLGTVPHLSTAYQMIGGVFVLGLVLLGLLIGLSMIFAGLAVDLIGIALTFSIAPGLAAACGSLVPFVVLHREKVFTPTGAVLLAGMLVVSGGVFLCALAGRLRERTSLDPSLNKPTSGRGLACAILSGLTAGLANFGLAFGQRAIVVAESLGTKPLWAANVIWMPMFLAACVPNALYCCSLLRRNNTHGRFLADQTASHWLLAAGMAFTWLASLLLYGVAAADLGELGPVLGWPLFEAIIVTTASLLGILTGEWKKTGEKPLRLQLSGVAVLILSIFVFSRVR